MALWLIIGVVVWVPLLFYGVERRGFVILLLWLFFAPIVANFVEYGGRDFFSSQGAHQASNSTFSNERDRRNLLAPNRLLFGAFGAVFLLHALLKKKRLGPFDKSEKLMALFSVVLLGSLFFQSDVVAYNLRVAADGFIVPFVAYFVVRRLTTSEERLRKLTRVFAYMSAYLLLTALFQGLQAGDITRVRGPFEHRDSLYIVIVVVFFVMLSDYMGRWKLPNDKEALSHWIRLFVICLTPIVVFLTWTRGNWLGFAVGVWVFSALSFRLLNFRRRLGTAALAIMLVPIILVGWREFSPSESIAERVGNDRNIYARLAAWQAVLETGLDNPVFGIGLGNTRTLLGSTVKRVEGTKNLSSTHNSFLAMFSELGAIGFLAYMLLLCSILRTGLILYRKGIDSRERWRGIAIVSMMAANLVPAFFSNILFSPVVSHSYVFVFVGAIAGVCNSRVKRRANYYVRDTQAIRGQVIRSASGM